MSHPPTTHPTPPFTYYLFPSSFSRDQLLVFGLGMAASALLSYKFTRDMYGSPGNHGKTSEGGRWIVSREDSGCSLEDCLATRNNSTLAIASSVSTQAIQESTSGGVINNNNNITTNTRVTSVGGQCGSSYSDLVHTETQTDRIADHYGVFDELVAVLNLRMIHTNIFMLKKHFEDELAHQLIGDLNIAFYRNRRLGNYIFIHANNEKDLRVATAFCAERYRGERVNRSLLPWRLFTENSVSYLQVSGMKWRKFGRFY